MRRRETSGDGRAVARTGLVLFAVTVGTFLSPLDSSIVNIALPDIASEFGVSLTSVGWVSSAYLLTSASIVLAMGRLGDVWGLRKVYVAGFVVFGFSSLACALSSSLPQLVSSRVVQAIGAAMMFATGPAIVVNVFPPGRRGRALGIMSVAVSVGLMVGPTLGGILLSVFDWPAIFVVNIPLSLLVAALAWRVLPVDTPRPASFDLAGSALAALVLFAFLVGLSNGNALGWMSAQTLGLLGLALLGGAGFVFLERRLAHPMLDMRLLDNRAFSMGALAAILTYCAFATVTFLLPFFLLRIQGREPWVAGIAMATAPAIMLFAGPIAGRLSDTWGSRGLTTAGLVIVSATLCAFSFLETGSSFWVVAVLGGTMGLGAALFGPPNTSAVLAETPVAYRGTGSAVVANARSIGMAVGIALSGAVVAARLTGTSVLAQSGVLSPSDGALLLEGISTALRVGAATAAIGIFVSWMRGPSKPAGS